MLLLLLLAVDDNTTVTLSNPPNWSVLLMAYRLDEVSLIGIHSCQAWAAFILRSGYANSAQIHNCSVMQQEWLHYFWFSVGIVP